MKEKTITVVQWAITALVVGGIVGSIAALFLVGLDFVTSTREENRWWVYALPLGGLLIGYMYHFLEKGVEGGNNRLIHEMILAKRKIHWKMAPLVILGTWFTHLFGGSAGREGTAVQMGGAIGDQFSGWFNWGEEQRKIVLRMGVAAGFAGVFGTPAAAVLFAYELGRDRKYNYWGLVPIIAAALIANFVCHAWQVDHTTYAITEVPLVNLTSVGWVVLVGIAFGCTALVFNYSKKGFGWLFTKAIPKSPIRPFVGGIVLLIVVLLMDSTRYLGLGVPIIQSAFVEQLSFNDFWIKLVLTAFTLGAGFKGGEATPLFFMGATLGSALVWFVPLPISLLAGLGFIAVFAGATNTPIACSIMGVELFGWEAFPYYILVCWVAYLISGRTSVYSEQQTLLRKYSLVNRVLGRRE